MDDIEIDGILICVANTPADILYLEDDEYYSSDFGRILPIIAQTNNRSGYIIPLEECHIRTSQHPTHLSSMSDRELGVCNLLDDGVSWAEGRLNHPKLRHITLCHAVHELTDVGFSVPDLMRLNSFEVSVQENVRQIREQDGSRPRWWKGCTFQEFTRKFMKEAEHRPEDMPIGTFIYKRACEYFALDEEDLRLLPDCSLEDEMLVEFLMRVYDKFNDCL